MMPLSQRSLHKIVRKIRAKENYRVPGDRGGSREPIYELTEGDAVDLLKKALRDASIPNKKRLH